MLYALMILLLTWLVMDRNKRSQQRRRALQRAHTRQQFAETQTRIATDFARAIHYEEIATALSNTFRQALVLNRMVVDFADENSPPHEFSYAGATHPSMATEVDFDRLYAGFEDNPGMRFHQRESDYHGRASGTVLSLSLIHI